MKRLIFSRRQILRAIHVACLALFFASCAQRAEAAPAFNPADFSVSGSTVTDKGVGDTTSAYFIGTGSGNYNVSIGGVSLGNTTTAGGTDDLLHFGTGSVTNSGTLTATNNAVFITGSGQVTNASGGIITGNTQSGVYIGGSGTINNAGTVTGAGNYAAAIFSGSITNSGLIHNTGSGSAAYIDQNGNVNNTGTILSDSGNAVTINGTGTVTNAGTISGAGSSSTSAVYINNGTVSNTGSISDLNGNGISINGAGTVTNALNATISSAYSGVYINGAGTVTNAGSISAADSISGYGIRITGVGKVTNTGSISSAYHLGGIGIQIDSGTVTNSGSINVNKSEDGNTGIHIVNDGVVTNSGTISAHYNDPSGSNSENYGIRIGGNGTVYNSGTISAYESNGVNQGIFIGGSTGFVQNTGTITATEALGFGNAGIFMAGNGTVLNSGGITVTNGNTNIGIDIEGSGTVTNTFSGYVRAFNASTGTGVFINQQGTVTNSGYIGGQNYGVFLSGDNSVVNANGGAIVGGNDSILLNGSNSTVNIFGRSFVPDTIEGSNNTGNALHFKLVGVSRAQAQAFNTYVANNTNSGAYTFSWSNGTQTYTWDGFAATTGAAVALEDVVDSGLQDVAAKIDNLNLPAGFDPFYVAASSDPEAALNTLTGREINNAIDEIGVNQSTALTSALNSHLDTLNNSGGAGGFDASNFHLSTASMVAFNNTNSQLDSLMRFTTGSAAGGRTSLSTDEKSVKDVGLVSNGPQWGAWASGAVTLADQSTTTNMPGYRATSGSPTLGVDLKVTPQLRVGALVNYTTTGANFSDGSRLGAQTGLGGIYGTWKQDHWHINGTLAGGYTSYDISRDVFGATATSHPGGWEALTDWTGGYDINLTRYLRLMPELGLTYTHLAVDGHTESGAGLFDLTVGRQNIDSLRSHFGAQLAASIPWGGVTFFPEVHAAYYHEFLDDDRGVTESLSGAPVLGSFAVQTSSVERDFGLVGFGLNTAFTGAGVPMAVFIDYNAQVGQDSYIAHNIDGGFRASF